MPDMQSMQRPTVNRAVHYVSYGTPGGEYPKACRAADVTQVLPEDPEHKDWVVGLFVKNPTGIFLHEAVEHHEGTDPVEEGGEPTDLCHGRDFPGGTWHWPEIVR